MFIIHWYFNFHKFSGHSVYIFHIYYIEMLFLYSKSINLYQFHIYTINIYIYSFCCLYFTFISRFGFFFTYVYVDVLLPQVKNVYLVKYENFSVTLYAFWIWYPNSKVGIISVINPLFH